VNLLRERLTEAVTAVAASILQTRSEKHEAGAKHLARALSQLGQRAAHPAFVGIERVSNDPANGV
jgi:hypothetical protein